MMFYTRNILGARTQIKGYHYTIERNDLVIFDDFGLQPLDNNSRLALQQILEDCYQRKSMIVTEELGGYVSLSVVVIVITGVLGNVLADFVLKLFRVEEPIAKGIAIGASSHAVGTAKAMEIGPVEGAMSSLSIVVCGILTVVGASVFANFI